MTKDGRRSSNQKQRFEHSTSVEKNGMTRTSPNIHWCTYFDAYNWSNIIWARPSDCIPFIIRPLSRARPKSSRKIAVKQWAYLDKWVGGGGWDRLGVWMLLFSTDCCTYKNGIGLGKPPHLSFFFTRSVFEQHCLETRVFEACCAAATSNGAKNTLFIKTSTKHSCLGCFGHPITKQARI